MIYANLMHLSYNMWYDTPPAADCPANKRDIHFSPLLRFDDVLWRECIRRMADAGLNMIIIDLGDGVRYRSHPEIAVDGAWTPAKLRDELNVCRELGVEPIPKLNFSACHDTWLREHSRRLSTPEYYGVCRDLIREACELFGGPRFFHLGMDEETYQHQTQHDYIVVRQHGLWWHDLNFMVDQVEAAGSRAWVWSDVLWNCGVETFAANMPRSVLQSNWYYGADFPEKEPPTYVKAFRWLEEMGYEQVPTGSNWTHPENYPRLVQYCAERISEKNLLGFMMTVWHPTMPLWRQSHVDAIAIAGAAHESLRGKRPSA